MPPLLRILLVEDDAPVARTLAHMLAEDGFDVDMAFDGAAAVRRLCLEPSPDVLVLDFLLPHVDGTRVAEYARGRLPEIPVILVTSYAEVLARSDLKLQPPPLVLSKPLVYSELKHELMRQLAKPAHA